MYERSDPNSNSLLLHPCASFDKLALVRLWSHEALRVFGDRLIDQRDRDWFSRHLEQMCLAHFNVKAYDAFRHLDTAGKKAIDTNDLRSLFYGAYMGPEDALDKPYEEVQDLAALQARMEQYLTDFNAQVRGSQQLRDSS